MIITLIFIIHFIFAFIVYRKKLDSESLSAALLNIGLIIIVFAIGWTLTSQISKWFMEPEGLGKFFNRDTFSLTLLTVVEFFFYRIYYKPDFQRQNKTENE